MSELQRKQNQIESLKKEVREMEREAMVGRCFIVKNKPRYLQITTVDASNYRVSFISIEEKEHSVGFFVEYTSNYLRANLLSECRAIDESLFITKTQEALRYMPLLKQMQDRKALEVQ